MSAERTVIDLLHEYTSICAGADTCAAREVLEPLLAERDRYREACLTREEADAVLDALDAGLIDEGGEPLRTAIEKLRNLAEAGKR